MSIILVVIIRSFISFFALLALVRLMGKQQIAELTFFDYVVGITIGSIASALSVQVNQNTMATLVGMGVWTILPILLAILSVKSSWIHKIVDGTPSMVIKNGKIIEDNLRHSHITIDELLSLLRNQGIFNAADVEFAIFEPNGKLSVQKKAENEPLTPKDMNINVQYQGMPKMLILDGKLQYETMKSLNLSKAWLMHQLKKEKIKDPSEVSLAQLDAQGNLYVDLQGDKSYYVISTKN